MTQETEEKIIAVFCDFENIAIGVRESNYEEFDIDKVLERLLLKGNIVVKKAYCDWARYQDFKPSMHEASFELIEIPHVRQSGKNSADIRMVVDALDLCYTKEHVDTFAIISGDSDFSPLVSKLRENNKMVIGVGVKNSTSDLLIANCDEFIYYDDLVKKKKSREKASKAAAKKKSQRASKNKKAISAEDKKKEEAWDLIVETFEALLDGREGGQGQDLGLHDQAGPQAPKTGIQRILLWFQVFRSHAGGSGSPRHTGTGAGSKIRGFYRKKLTPGLKVPDGAGTTEVKNREDRDEPAPLPALGPAYGRFRLW